MPVRSAAWATRVPPGSTRARLVPDPEGILLARCASGQRYFGTRKYYAGVSEGHGRGRSRSSRPDRRTRPRTGSPPGAAPAAPGSSRSVDNGPLTWPLGMNSQASASPSPAAQSTKHWSVDRLQPMTAKWRSSWVVVPLRAQPLAALDGGDAPPLGDGWEPFADLVPAPDTVVVATMNRVSGRGLASVPRPWPRPGRPSPVAGRDVSSTTDPRLLTSARNRATRATASLSALSAWVSGRRMRSSTNADGHAPEE